MASDEFALPGLSVISQFGSVCLSFKVDVSVESENSLGLVGSLCESGCLCKRVRTNSSRPIVVFPCQMGSPVSSRLLVRIISFWFLNHQLLVRLLLSTPPSALLNHKQFVFIIHRHVPSILSPHYSPSNYVLLQILLIVKTFICRFEIAQLFLGFFYSQFVSNLLGNLLHNFIFKILLLLSDFWDTVSRVGSSS